MTGKDEVLLRYLSLFVLPMFFLVGILAVLFSAVGDKFKCPKDMVCVDPTKLACFVFDMGVDKWKLVRDREERQYISVDVYKGRSRYKHQKKGADCYEIDQHFVLGDKVVMTVPVEWFKPNK